ncbi:hypothetical protein FPQ18DRAFT_322813 [Pyronema domesticum]|nr:hypothetical protein FPQ18DRAFT_322813 [Pyronema domesticum]
MVVQSHELPSSTNPDDLVDTRPEAEDDARPDGQDPTVSVGNSPKTADLTLPGNLTTETPPGEGELTVTADDKDDQPPPQQPAPIHSEISTPVLRAKTDAELAALTSGLSMKHIHTRDDAQSSRPDTPAVIETNMTDMPISICSPPPPAPPPKDLPPKDLPSKDVLQSTPSPNGRLYLEHPPVTPGNSRPSTPLPESTPSAPGKSHSDDENDGTSSVIHDLVEKSHRDSLAGEQLQRSHSTSSIGSPILAGIHPPRSSSLSTEHSEPSSSTQPVEVETQTANLNRPLSGSGLEKPLPTPILSTQKLDSTPTMPATLHRPPPPDEGLPFDFHRFLSQLRHRSADPVARFLRSFLHEFAKKQWMVHEQVKIVRDFLNFIYAKMDLCEVWREVGDGEMDNAMEGMEKLVMNRLYTQTFSPAIPAPDGRRTDEQFPGRRGQHQEDVERDEVLTQKVRIYSWIREEHLDIEDTVSGDAGRRFLDLAVKEMLKIGTYRAPRDKVICVLNCCKVIFGLLRHSKSDESADKFVPLLIYVVLRANPEHLVSNVQYILRFRNPDKLTGEAGYYLSSLMGAIQFIENLDRSSLTITAEEFERNVEAAVAAIAERPPPASPPPLPPKPLSSGGRPTTSGSSTSQPRPSSSRISEKEEHQESDEKLTTAATGILRTLQKPLTTIGRIFADELTSGSSASSSSDHQNQSHQGPGNQNQQGDDALLTALGGRRGPRRQGTRPEAGDLPGPAGHPGPPARQGSSGYPGSRFTPAEAAARQASAEAEEARRIGRMEYEQVVLTLQGMFPTLDREVICDVVNIKEGRVGDAVDVCLALCTTEGV